MRAKRSSRWLSTPPGPDAVSDSGVSGTDWLRAVTLRGESVVLEPLTQAHAPDLAAAARDLDRDDLWYTAVPDPGGVPAEIERRLTLLGSGAMLPFAVIDRATSEAIGMTTYMNVDAVNRRLEIGSTWYRRRAWRTSVNTECKLLLLTHAFERLDCIAVEFRTAFVNMRSRRAIERLGAKLDGVLRSHAVFPNGALRDTCVYSIVRSEWPAVRALLTSKRKPIAEQKPAGPPQDATLPATPGDR